MNICCKKQKTVRKGRLENILLSVAAGVFLLTHFCKALTAIYRTVITGDERYGCYTAASSTGSFVHLSGSSAGIFTLVAAGFAALRLVYKAFGLIEFLLSCSENEFFSAFFAN